jgi:thymidine phosphorylase
MLRLKRMAIDTWRENVAYLARDCVLYRPQEFQAFAKIELSGNGHRILASLNVIDDPALLGPDEIGVSAPCFALLGMPEGSPIAIAPAPRPQSLEAVRAKIQGNVLSPDDYAEIIRDVASSRYSRMEIAAFLVGSAAFMTTEEVLSLTRAMAAVGNRLAWPHGPIVDKHCIGGIPGNRTSMIVVPIVAAHGLSIPKTSSRAITSPAGTADTMEVLARVDIGVEEMQDIVARTNGCLVWGGRANLSPADDVLISVERPLGIDMREQLVASILSKKVAAGSTHLVIDIPVGPSAKVREQGEAVRLRKLFEYIGGHLGLDVHVKILPAREPVGRGIGPVLEARDVLQVLRNDPAAPTDLRERAILLAGAVIDFDAGLEGGAGAGRARELLESGAALRAMERIIEAQGRASITADPGPLTQTVLAETDGFVAGIDCFRISRIARLAGAPMDPGAGIDLLAKVGDRVERGQPLYRVHAAFPSDFGFACAHAAKDSGFTLTPQ